MFGRAIVCRVREREREGDRKREKEEYLNWMNNRDQQTGENDRRPEAGKQNIHPQKQRIKSKNKKKTERKETNKAKHHSIKNKKKERKKKKKILETKDKWRPIAPNNQMNENENWMR